jgi:hypothetical protein
VSEALLGLFKITELNTKSKKLIKVLKKGLALVKGGIWMICYIAPDLFSVVNICNLKS